MCDTKGSEQKLASDCGPSTTIDSILAPVVQYVKKTEAGNIRVEVVEEMTGRVAGL
jgi:hypothetical protein